MRLLPRPGLNTGRSFRRKDLQWFYSGDTDVSAEVHDGLIEMNRKMEPNEMSAKKIVYFDMDGVLVDFQSGIDRLEGDVKEIYRERYDEVPGIFSLMDPLPGGLDAFRVLSAFFDCYILTTAPWRNPTALNDKLLWVKQHLGDLAHKRLITTHHKNLNRGDFLIDDRLANGAGEFGGIHIYFGSPEFPDWDAVLKYLMPRV